MSTYHYTACGLDNVFIDGLPPVVDHAGNKTFTIPAINELHKVICEGIVCHENSMNGFELRFLRSEMGLTQAELARTLQCESLTVGRWERGEVPLSGSSEAVIRKLAVEALNLQVNKSMKDLAESSVPSTHIQENRIVHDEHGYSLATDCAAA